MAFKCYRKWMMINQKNGGIEAVPRTQVPGLKSWSGSKTRGKNANHGTDLVLHSLSTERMRSTISWLVVYLPLWKIWVCQLGWWHSQYMEKEKMFEPTNQYQIFYDFLKDGSRMDQLVARTTTTSNSGMQKPRHRACGRQPVGCKDTKRYVWSRGSGHQKHAIVYRIIWV